ncbi:MAG: hypothetical protein QXR53_01845 [Candidatus Norongarragalinales archaeon]
MALDGETLVILIFIILAVGTLNNGGWSTDHPLVWAPAMLVQAPFALFSAISSTAPLLAPLALIGLLAYVNFIGATLGEAFLTLVVFGWIIVFMGV